MNITIYHCMSIKVCHKIVTRYSPKRLESGGSVEGMIVAVEYVIAKLSADVKVILGHGPASNPDGVRKFVALPKETKGVVEKAGKRLDQMRQEKILERWKKTHLSKLYTMI